MKKTAGRKKLPKEDIKKEVKLYIESWKVQKLGVDKIRELCYPVIDRAAKKL